MTSTVSRHINGSPADVWAVFSDGWLYGVWVVGASRIREVDDAWPAVGTGVHHSVGTWPLVIDDVTSVVSAVPEHELELKARAWPSGEATVRITLERQGEQTLVTMTEDASKGPALLIPSPARRVALDWRNRESLERLSFLVEHRARSATRES